MHYFYCGIKNSDLTAVVRDAVMVCRALEVPFLWVDALCIIQDSKSDWEHQSQEMSQVFENAWMTICAISSSYCQEGFLKRRQPIASIEYTSRIDDTVHGLLELRPIPIRYRHAPPFFGPYNTMFTHDLQASRWNTRAWVLQERSMSYRKLYFGHTMLHIQEGNQVVSENGCKEVMSVTKPTLELKQALAIKPILDQGLLVYDLWQELVMAFAHLDYTDERDLFPALSGIAAAFAENTNDEYVAGHWLRDLPWSLSWITRSNPNLQSLQHLLHVIAKGNMQNAPTWSWASRGRDFHRFWISVTSVGRCRIRAHLRPEITAESRVSIDGNNPFGRLKNAHLWLSGKLVDLRGALTLRVQRETILARKLCYYRTRQGHVICIELDWVPPPLTTEEEGIQTGMTPDEEMNLRLLLTSSCCSSSPGNIEAIDYDGKTVENIVWKVKFDFHTFFEDAGCGETAIWDCSYCQDTSRRKDIWGLLLYPAGGQNRFYRVGAFLSRAEHGGSDLFQEAETCHIELV